MMKMNSNILFAVFVILSIQIGSIECLICETCDGTTCYDKDRWIQEFCPPSTQYCYRLSMNGKAFRRGCSDYPCSSLPGVESGMECRTCSHDRCNKERDNFFYQHGGGLTWKKSSSSVFGFGVLAVVLLV